MAFIITAITSFLAYLVFTAGSWNRDELVAGALLSLIVAIISKGFHFRDDKLKRNPLRAFFFLIYIAVPFFLELTKANIDVALRVLTGKIRPGLVKYTPGTKSDFGTMLLANSITLTPGTLTVTVDDETNDLYVHLLNVPQGEETKTTWQGKDLFSMFDLSAWVRRIAE